MAKSSFLTQLRAILIRNFQLKIRGKKQTITEVVSPLYFIVILIIVSIGIPPSQLPLLPQPQTAYNIHDVGPLQGQMVAVVGDNEFDDIIDTLTIKLYNSSISTQRFYNESDFSNYYGQNYSGINFAVVFTNISSGNVSYTIRPSLDLGLPDLSTLYATEDMCHPKWDDDPSVFQSNEMKCNCPARKYYDAGFILLQTLVDTSIYKTQVGQDVLLNMTVVVFPKGEFKGNPVLLRSLVPLYMAIAFTPFVAFLCILVVGEKEKKIKDAMKLMGLRESVYWLGWLITYGVLVLLLSILTAILLVEANIIPHANIFLLFLLLALYGFSTISISFLVTPFFSSAKAAGGFASLASTLFSVLYYVSVYVKDVPPAAYYAMSLLSPTAFALGMDRVVELDLSEDGLNFSNFWEEGYCFGSSVIMLAVDIVLYALLAYYFDNVIPGEYGRKRPPWFFLMPSYWFPKPKTQARVTDQDAIVAEMAANPNFEKVANDLIGHEAIRIFNIRKVFSGCTTDEMVAVDGISLDIYRGQITAILGHNGAGKTTLMNMLVGLTSPTSGTATIEGLDIADPNNYDLIWEMIGICPQQDNLFDVLTPEQHLQFYGRLKGIPEKDLQKTVENILDSVDLTERKHAPAAKLSGGQKRKLSVGIAIIGDSKVIILDEPTSGVDPYSRRHMWNLLQQMKKDRVIILTTHFMDEADILADRKAIVSHGKVQCVGSSLFLKNRFGLGYHLTIVVENVFDDDGIAALIKYHIPNSEKARGSATELAYRLPFDEVSKFPALLTALDKAVQKITPHDNLGIRSYGMSMTTLEEVFLKLGEEVTMNGVANSDKYKSEKHGSSQHSDSDDTANHIEFRAATYNWSQAFFTMMRINFLTVLRLPRQIVTTVIVPIILIVITFYLLTIPTSIDDAINKVQLGFSMYPNYNVVVVTSDASISLEPFLNQLDMLDIPHTSSPNSFAELLDYKPHTFYLNVTKFDSNSYAKLQLNSFQIQMSIEASYNDTAQHSLPILVNFVTNALMGLTDNWRPSKQPVLVSSFIEPLPRHEKPTMFYGSTYSAIFLVGFAYSMITAVFSADSVDEKETKVRHQLQVSGLPFTVYWFSKFLSNIVLFCITLVATIIAIVAFQVEPFTEGAPLGILILGYVLYIFAGLFSGYCFGFAFKKYDTAQSFLPVFSLIAGFAPYIAVSLCDMLIDDNGKIALILHYVFTILLPLYSPYALTYFLSKVYLDNQWTGKPLSGKDYFTEQVVVTLVALPILAVLYLGLLWVLDFRSGNGQWSELFHCVLSRSISSSGDSLLINDDVQENEDDDVREERLRVQHLIDQGPESADAVVIMQGLRKEFVTNAPSLIEKWYKKSKKGTVKVAVRNLSLAVDKGEVFGLLGPNGAGKTSSLRTMVADEIPTKGKVYVAGYDMSVNLKQAIQKMGYCPQHDALWKSITVREHLECYANIRGIKPSQISKVVDSLLNGLQISEHAKKKTQHLSGGTKRKLSYAISILGNPKIVLLDEPSTGMDPQSKRYLWDTVLDNFRGERGAVLTTHSMEEADFLCSRVGIMVHGELKCIGATQHLKNKFGSGYILEAKLLASHQRSSKFGSLDDAIKSIFREATVQERFEDRVKYQIPQTENLSLAQIFSTLEDAKQRIGIEEYSFSQTTLEQVFLDFAKLQEYEGGRKDSKLTLTHF